MSSKVRLAFVGLGWWSNKLADAAAQCDNIEIAACYSRSLEKRDLFRKQYGGVGKETYEELLEDKSIDGIVLTTPNSLHITQTVDAANYGKHVYVEKPMAITVEECKKMIDASKSNNVILMIGQNSRRMARFRKAKQMIEQGLLGKIVLVEANSSGDLGMKLTPDNWRGHKKESPAGPLMSYTVHQADNLNYLIGPITKITAFKSKLCGPAETDDVFTSIAQFENGALGYIGGSFITPDRKLLQIHGTEGVILLDEDDGSISYQKKGTKHMVKTIMPNPDQQRLDSLKEEIKEFADCIQLGKEPEVTGAVGMNAIAIIEAIYRSAENGNTTQLRDLL
ncbi:Glucose--fructose oxidoreductase [bioreactor metagenome]|jgi:predicted dehydrogenase|uniref:Oxidoreductase domain protein n=2 Tax=root TaxID=1 RepID=A0A652ZWG8_9SPIR|nr:Gfo/Idh/MocA family oxidoreductase [Spirochaetia bacterium]VBB40136.1 conserved hypothetical protein [uncultured Spirochaetota bacterium]HOI22316.1 Gfo/Idh/MocA family oxidoreductase [Spirochaetales bacterium]